MCGLFGELTWGGLAEAPAPALEPVLEALRRRGPDGKGVHQASGPGWRARLAHARLKIIDLSERAAQPMSSPDGRFVVAFNGEIYGYRELRRELEAAGRRFTSDSDTEVLLAALEAWGAGALARLDGIFAFVLLDRADGSLLAARDHLGVKPLYYHAGPGLFAAASEVRAILASQRVGFEPEPAAVASYLAFGSVSGPVTALAGVRELPPGHLVRVDTRGVRLERYWSPNLEVHPPVANRAEAAAEVGRRLSDAVAAQLVADVPVGVFLSGGMDSGALVALAAERRGGDVDAFTVGLPEQDAGLDESAEARRRAEAFGVRHHLLVLTPDEALASLDDWIAALDQPSIDGLNSYVVSRAVRRAGVTVALSGTGSDELFGGYPHLRRTPLQRQGLRALRLAAAALGPVGPLARLVRGRSIRLDKALAVASGGDTAEQYAAQRALFLLRENPELVAPAHRAAWCAASNRAWLSGLADGLDGDAALRVLELQNYLPNTLLRDTDVMSMWHGLEVRVPFLDHRLVEFVLSLPPSWNHRRGQTKPLLADAMRGRIPEQGPKRGFSLPFARWLRGPLRADAERRLGRLEWAGQFVAAAGARSTWRRLVAGDDSACSRVWAVYVLDRWLERGARDAGDAQRRPAT